MSYYIKKTTVKSIMIELENLQKKFDANVFSMDIESRVRHGSTYLEAIVEFCEENEIAMMSITSLVKKSDVIRSKLEAECMDLNLLEKSAKLPL